MTQMNRVVTTVGAALAGAAVGYAAGLLTAPAKGRDTRRRLGHQLEDEAQDLARRAEHTLRDAKHKLADVVRG